MFTVTTKNKDQTTFVSVSNSTKSIDVLINLNQGGRIEQYTHNNVLIIKDFDAFPYEKSYASSILFPFVSRIEKGKYAYKNITYQLECNEPLGKDALHGLVYNKEFSILKTTQSSEEANVVLVYKEQEKSIGFPYLYTIQLTYSITKNGVKLKVDVINNDNKTFPFTIGWHPYFCLYDVTKSELIFKSDKKIAFNENLITKEITENPLSENINLSNKTFDDCFVLNDDNVVFKTSTYQLSIKSDKKENFLQIYTPPNLPIIAIEPMVGVSNSFNNGIGLQELKSQESYSISWDVTIKTTKNEI